MPPRDAAAGHPDGVAADVMIAAVAAGGMRRASHFAGPEHQRVVQQSARFRVADQRRHRLVGDPGVLLVPQLEFAVLVPGCVVRVGQRASHLDEPDSRLDQPPGPQALQGVKAVEVVGAIDAVQSAAWPGFRRFTSHSVGHERLHPRGDFVIADRRLRSRPSRRCAAADRGVLLAAESRAWPAACPADRPARCCRPASPWPGPCVAWCVAGSNGAEKFWKPPLGIQSLFNST